LLRAHAALEDDRIVLAICECFREVVDVASALCEHQAVSASLDRVHHVGEDLLVARLVVGECTVNARDRARDGEVDRFRQLE